MTTKIKITPQTIRDHYPYIGQSMAEVADNIGQPDEFWFSRAGIDTVADVLGDFGDFDALPDWDHKITAIYIKMVAKAYCLGRVVEWDPAVIDL